jgi:hypothetical protein
MTTPTQSAAHVADYSYVDGAIIADGERLVCVIHDQATLEEHQQIIACFLSGKPSTAEASERISK